MSLFHQPYPSNKGNLLIQGSAFSEASGAS